MSDLERLRALRGDLATFGRECVKVRAKDGSLQPFLLNDSQRALHAVLERQKAECGWVRALVLKGRQQGCCYVPETRVLTSAYQWRALADVRPGEQLLAFDEDYPGVTPDGRAMCRKLRTTVVEAVAKWRRPVFEIVLGTGHCVTVTGEHRHLCRKRGGDTQQWRRVSDTREGDFIRLAMRAPWADDDPHEDGWFGGLIDGEGSARGHGSVRLSVHQRDGAVLQRAKAWLRRRGIPFSTVIDARESGVDKLGRDPVYRLDIHRMPFIAEILGRCRPSRFAVAGIFDGQELPGKRVSSEDATFLPAWGRVVSITPKGVCDVIDLQTTHKTYIAEGLCSHNSTYTAVRYYHRASMHRGVNVFILSHEQSASDTLFGMVDRMHRHNPIAPRVGVSNVKELEFDKLDSSYAVATAGNKAVGRSKTTNLFHGSEVSYWMNAADHFAASVQAVPLLPGTEIILESTSAGAGGSFYERYIEAERGVGDYIAVFLPWWLDSGYQREPPPGFTLSAEAEPGFLSEQEYADTYRLSLDRMAWRRGKMQELRSMLLFQREYPADPSEAWTAPLDHEPYIANVLVIRARKRTTSGAGPLIVGVDPASGGGDRFAVAARRGARVEWVRWRHRIDHMEAATWLRSLIDEHRPARMNIDAGSIGAAVIAQVKAMGPEYAEIVRSINFGGTSQAKLARPKAPGPRNRRAEMYQRLLEWLEAPDGAALPDLPELQTDIVAPRLKSLPNNDFILESKEDMRRRGVRSTDLSDAVALTFASSEFFKTWHEPGAAIGYADIDNPARQGYTQQPWSAPVGGPHSWMS